MTESFQWLLMQGSISHLLKPIFLIYVTLFLCISHCWTGSDTAEVLRPRGVPLSKKVFYEPSRDFSCIDGSGTYPFHFVNDDFCDCADGSDEPGTAACPNGVFHCINAGYVSQNIPSSRVNDGICDCCDGSDEYNSSADCINLCMEFGRKAREEAQKRQELYEEGHSLWKEYALQGKQIKENNKAKVENLRKAEEEAEKIKTEKEAIKNEAEGREKAALGKYESVKDEKLKEEEEQEMMQHQEEERIQAKDAFKELDKNQDGIVTYDELQQFPKFDSNRDGVVSEEEAMLTTPPPVIHPPPEQVPLVTPPSEREEEQEENYNLEDYDIPEDEPSDDEEEEEHLETPPEFPPKEEAELDNQTVDKKEEIQYDEETQKLIDEAKEARSEHKEATDRLEKIRDEIRQVQTDLDTDFGAEEEFAVLKGQCFDFDDREYTYRFCPFDKASQIPKAGGSDINLGRWGYWAGPENNKYSKMKLESGQVCWNGPQRSVMVLFHCGLTNNVFATSEPNRCEYLFNFNSPSLCSSLPTDIHRIHEHTEL